jgi:hypothetical protein
MAQDTSSSRLATPHYRLRRAPGALLVCEFLSRYCHLHFLISSFSVDFYSEQLLLTLLIITVSSVHSATCVAEAGIAAGNKDEVKRLKKENKQLKEQNNLLACKIDILVDMVGQGFLCSHCIQLRSQLYLLLVVRVCQLAAARMDLQELQSKGSVPSR